MLVSEALKWRLKLYRILCDVQGMWRAHTVEPCGKVVQVKTDFILESIFQTFFSSFPEVGSGKLLAQWLYHPRLKQHWLSNSEHQPHCRSQGWPDFMQLRKLASGMVELLTVDWSGVLILSQIQSYAEMQELLLIASSLVWPMALSPCLTGEPLVCFGLLKMGFTLFLASWVWCLVQAGCVSSFSHWEKEKCILRAICVIFEQPFIPIVIPKETEITRIKKLWTPGVKGDDCQQGLFMSAQFFVATSMLRECLTFPSLFCFFNTNPENFNSFQTAEGHLVPVPCLGLSSTITHAEAFLLPLS